ncbi:hypothetical protein [Streptomyces sp. NPDC054797]
MTTVSPVPATPAPRRRPALIGAALAAVLAAGAVGIVQWLPDGTSGDDHDAKGASPTRTTATTTAPPASAGGTPASKASTPKASAPRGGMLTPENIRTALEAFKQQTGTTTFVDLRIYDGYVLASIPTAPGAQTVDSWQYRDGTAKRTGPKGTVEDGKPLIDMATVSWDALPGLLEQSKKDLNVPNPTSRYVIVEPWMMDQVPCMRPYLSDEYGRGGYVLAGIDGKVKKVVSS